MTHPLSVDLDGKWMLTFGPEKNGPGIPERLEFSGWPAIPARVPGRIEEALVEAGIEPDPHVGDHAYRFLAYEEYEWWYSRTISAPELPDGQRWQLVLDGVDCFATIWIDGEEVGRTANMLIPHRFDVPFTSGTHHLQIRIASAVRVGRQDNPPPGANMQSCNWESWRVRKAPHQYGWDILPRFVSAGLWRSARLEAVPFVRVRECYWGTLMVDAVARRARVAVTWTLDLPESDWQTCDVRLRLERHGRVVCEQRRPVLSHHGRSVLEVVDADLWWPLGWGEPALYRASVELLNSKGEVLAEFSHNIGLRTVELQRTDSTTVAGNGKFNFIVNGLPLFARGTNWVGLDALHRLNERRLEESIAMLVDLNCNMVRCWGGAPYEDDQFYKACDRSGILVWQDFALACSIPPQDDAFAEAMRIEAEAVVRRLRHHPCLALWCGGNETDDAYTWGCLPGDPNFDRVTRQVLPAVIREHDPLRSYLPNSPYISPHIARGEARPEDHLWGTRDDFMGAFYRGSAAHFVSEIGYHGCPEVASLEQMLGPDAALWPILENPAYECRAGRPMARHTDCDYRLPLMVRQARLLIKKDPTDLDAFVLASQITQAEALKSFIELWRLRKGRTSGLLWWNLRDGWPIISDAIVDWYGRRKIAYEVIRRSQAISVALAGEVENGLRRIVVVNDGREACRGTLLVKDLEGSVLLEANVIAGKEKATEVDKLPDSIETACWRLEWTPEEGVRTVNHLLAGARPYDLATLVRWYRQLDIPLPASRFSKKMESSVV